MDGGWGRVSFPEVMGAITVSVSIGFVKTLLLLRKAQSIRKVDWILEPSLAVVGGMMIWAITEWTDTPDLLQAVMTSLGAWGGPQVINALERKYLGPLTDGNENR